MNTQNNGAAKRRTLSLNFKRKADTPALNLAGAAIPSHELRRLVAAMVD